jgi:hydroxypyruvate isomerase
VAELAAFVDAVSAGGPAPVGGEDTRAALAIALAAAKDIEALARTGGSFSSMTGYVRGTLADPDGADQLPGSAEQSLQVAEQLDCPASTSTAPGATTRSTRSRPSAGPHLRMNLDLDHAQIGAGNLIQLLERALPLVGEIQVADVPGRGEPGTGGHQRSRGRGRPRPARLTGVVGLEAWASGDPQQARERFRAAFTV